MNNGKPQQGQIDAVINRVISNRADPSDQGQQGQQGQQGGAIDGPPGGQQPQQPQQQAPPAKDSNTPGLPGPEDVAADPNAIGPSLPPNMVEVG